MDVLDYRTPARVDRLGTFFGALACCLVPMSGLMPVFFLNMPFGLRPVGAPAWYGMTTIDFVRIALFFIFPLLGMSLGCAYLWRRRNAIMPSILGIELIVVHGWILVSWCRILPRMYLL